MDVGKDGEEDLLTLIHEGDEYGRYLHAVVPPVFLNSLHVYDSVEEYNSVDIFSDDKIGRAHV